MSQTKSFNLISPGKLLWLALFLFGTVNAQELQLNQPIEGEIKKDETQIFKIAVQKNDLVRVTVWQKKADLSLQTLAGNGQKIIEINNSTSLEEPERISFIANQTGKFQIEVKGLKIWKKIGQYQIILEVLRPSTATDKSQIEAEKLYYQAKTTWHSKQTEAKAVALKKFTDSVPLFQSAQDKLGEGLVYFNLGELYSEMNDLPKSVENSAKAAQIFAQINFPLLNARAFLNEAAIHFKLESLEKSMALTQKALVIYQKENYREGLAEIVGNLGLIASGLGQPETAIKYFEDILPIFQSENNLRLEAWTFHNLGSVYDDLGQPGKAIDYYEKALKIRRELDELQPQAATLVNLAVTLKGKGENEKAIELLKEALKIYEELGNEINQASCFNNLGANYDDLGDYVQALQYYYKSFDLNQKYKLRSNQAGNLNNLAIVYIKLRNFDQALEVQTQALAIFRELKDKIKEAIARVNLGVILQRKGDPAKALEFLQASLPIFRQAQLRDWEAQVLFHLGEFQLYSGDFQSSFENCAKSLEINRQIESREGAMVALLCTAKAENKLGRPAEAQATMEKALALIEDFRAKISQPDVQANFLTTHQDFYEFYLELLMQRHQLEPTKGFDVLALQTSERAKARNLLESIGNTELREGVPPELITQEKDLRQKINQLETLRQQLISNPAPKEKLAEVEKEIDENLRGWHEVWAKIRLTNPKLANFTQPTPLNLAEIQKQVLDENSVLLEYALGEKRSFLFVITKTSLQTVELPKRLEIEQLARNFYESLKARTKKTPQETEAQRENRLQKADAERQKNALALSKILLAPVAQEIDNKRLLIVSAEVLQYIPFSALISPKSENQFLIETNEVVNLPSASTLATLRKTERKPSPKEIAIFADPIFAGNDERIKPKTAFRSNFERLVSSGNEAKMIASFAPSEKRFLALDFEANLKNLRQQDLQQFRLLHFATHGTLDSRFPELSSLVLSLVDEKGNSQEGFLRLSEIYNLKLNAQMVVLSACETGLGNYIKGEGLVGLSHAFMYAGAESVVASLWRVKDYSTSELMQRFYQAMLKEGLPPAKALQKAQISMIKEKGLNNPYYWSAFTLQGEWR